MVTWGRMAPVVKVACLGLAALSLAGPAYATDGYFQTGYGMKTIGMGGTAYALTNGGMNGANNPAAASFAENQVDLGIYLFAPWRSASRTGNAYGLNGSADSGSNLFPIPEAGYNQHLNDRFTIGLAVYGNGGMDTAYPGGQIPAGHCGPGAPSGNLLCGQGTLGVDLTQLIFAPTLAYKVNSRLSIGIAPQLAVQQFSAYGLQPFTQFSVNPNNVTGQHFSYSYGAGVRIGAYMRVNSVLALGLTYQSPIYSTRFAKYRGLFAGEGSFDIPANLGVGIALHLTPKLVVAADYERIFYGEVAAIANSSTAQAPLGSSNGPGFGWRSINVFKAGIAYDPIPRLTLRLGYNHSENPIRPGDVTFNILAPGVIQDHIAAGATYNITQHGQITVAYTHGFPNTVSGATSPLLPGGGVDRIRLSLDEVGLAYAWTF